MNVDEYVPAVSDTQKRHPVISNGHVTSKVSLHINEMKFRCLAFYLAMVCCQPALMAKMKNMTGTGAQSGHDFLCLCMPKFGCSYYRGSVARILMHALGSLQTIQTPLFLLFKYILIIAQMSWI